MPDAEAGVAAITSIDCAEWAVEPAVLGGTGATLRQVYIKAGHVAERHSHDYEQFLRVISGAGRLMCAAGTLPLHAGVAVHLPPGAWHSAEFTADTVLMEVNVSQAGDRFSAGLHVQNKLWFAIRDNFYG